MTISWEYDLREAIAETLSEDGEQQFIFNVEIIDYYLQTLTHLTRDKATHISSSEDQTEIETKTKQLIQVLDIILETYPSDTDVLMRAAYAQGISHNLSFPDAVDKTINLYQQVLKIEPDNPKANFLLGMFLFGIRDRLLESEPYLEKALQGGIESCRFTLGMVYLQKDDVEKALEYIAKFAEDYPDNQHAQLVLEALRSKSESEESN